jgi:hypothetical protein
MRDPKLIETFNFFKDVIFERLIKKDIMGLEIDTFDPEFKIVDIELSEEYTINDYTGKIYPEFIVSFDGYIGGYSRNVREVISSRIKKTLDMYYPSDEFVILGANIFLRKI